MLKVFSFIEVVKTFHYYVINERTGDANTFARRLGISRASLYRLISELSDYGVHIEYCRERKTYKYTFPKRVIIDIRLTETSDDEC